MTRRIRNLLALTAGVTIAFAVAGPSLVPTYDTEPRPLEMPAAECVPQAPRLAPDIDFAEGRWTLDGEVVAYSAAEDELVWWATAACAGRG